MRIESEMIGCGHIAYGVCGALEIRINHIELDFHNLALFVDFIFHFHSEFL